MAVLCGDPAPRHAGRDERAGHRGGAAGPARGPAGERDVTRRARRLLVLVAGAALALGLSACGSSSSSSQTYQVRAIFDDANNVIAGENVRIAGVNVGAIGSLSVTPQQQAAIVLDITNAGFQDFRSDATCIIRPQALIGEQFVDCTPTQARQVGAPEPPPLPVIPHGQPGAGEHYLPVTQTSSPVALDLVGDISRLPYTQRLTVLINELGAGLAGNGQALEQVVERADPTLAAVDNVLSILASENKTLARLATDSNTVIAPLARDREQVADFIAQSNTVATVSAEHRAALGQSLEKLPTFLDELVPTLRDLSGLSDQANPVLRNLDAASPGLNQAVTHLAPFSNASTTYFTSLGQTGVKGVSQIQQALPLVNQLGSLGTSSKTFAQGTATLLTGLEKQGGLTNILQFLFRSALGSNGYDSLGHFARSYLTINPNCINIAITANASCNANFQPKVATASSARAASTAVAAKASAVDDNPASNTTTDTLLSYLLGQ